MDKIIITKKIVFVLLLVTGFFANGQINIDQTKHDNDLKLSALPYYSFGKGVGITSPDSLYQFNIRKFMSINRLFCLMFAKSSFYIVC